MIQADKFVVEIKFDMQLNAISAVGGCDTDIPESKHHVERKRHTSLRDRNKGVRQHGTHTSWDERSVRCHHHSARVAVSEDLSLGLVMATVVPTQEASAETRKVYP